MPDVLSALLLTLVIGISRSYNLCDVCLCDATNRSVVCFDVDLFENNDLFKFVDLFENNDSSVIKLTLINETHPLIVPWNTVAGSPVLQLLNLSSTYLSCDCRNSWLAFLADIYNSSVIDISSIPDGVIKYYLSDSMDQNYSTAAIFKLPEFIILPQLSFNQCFFNSIAKDARSYFESRCDLKRPETLPNDILTPLINETFRASCSIKDNNNVTVNREKAECIRIQFLSTSANVSQLDVPLKCSTSTTSHRDNHVTATVNNSHNGFLMCTFLNPYLPRAILKPIYVMGPPQIEFHKVTDDYSKFVVIFVVNGYPKAKIDLINFDNKEIIDNALSRKILRIEEIDIIGKGRNARVLVEFREVMMNCINGHYQFKACNKFGCDSYNFTVDSGMPKNMCPYYAPNSNNNKSLDPEKLDEFNQDPTSILPPPRVIHDSWIYIAVPFVVVFAVVMVGVLTTCFFLRMFGWSREKLLTARTTRARGSLIDWEMSPLSSNNPANLNPNVTYVDWLESIKSRVAVFPPEHLDVQKELGEGAFGRVYLAEYKMADDQRKIQNCYTNLLPTNEKRHFAMKVLKNVTGEKLEDLEREMKIMSSLTHPNIVKFYGISFKCGTLALLFECMENGDLVNYLRNNSIENVQCQSPLSCNDLLNISCQIARGLDYLASEHLVHRDLAARNCLVGENMLVKISDFGMTRDIYITDYYKMGAHTLVPLRWLPPESILYRKFTAESDVWSFGVLIWEIFSLGKVPWYMYSNCEVLQIIQDGKLLEQPEGCPAETYALMLGCWAKNPSDRLTANQLLTKLETILENRLRYCNLVESEHGSSAEKDVFKQMKSPSASVS